MKRIFKPTFEESKKKLIHCNDFLKFDKKIINICLYLLKISIEDKTYENRNPFIKTSNIINEIKDMTLKLNNKEDMIKIIFMFDFFSKKYPNFPNIKSDLKSDLKSVNIIWHGIYGWYNEVIFYTI